MTTKKGLVFSKDIAVSTIKDTVKKLETPDYKASINDIVMAIFSKTMQEYCHSKGEEHHKIFKLVCPFSLRRPPTGIMDFEYNNDFSICPVSMPVVRNFKEGVPAISASMKKLKASLLPIGINYVNTVTMAMPRFLADYLLTDFVNKHAFGYSNVPGPRKPWTVGGVKCKKIAF